MVDERTYADHFTELLTSLGYSHCFLVPGGATMHLVNAARSRMTCIPVVNEVSAAIAAEYFNEISVPAGGGRAYALVTSGPGLTNALTGMAGAFLESRDLLVVGGQVKSADLARGVLRQRGIQELDGLSMAAPVCKAAVRVEKPLPDAEVVRLVSAGLTDRKGPVFIEMCLDAQGAPVPVAVPSTAGLVTGASAAFQAAAPEAATAVLTELKAASRPVLLIGGGVDAGVAASVSGALANLGVPLMTTWNGFDRVADTHPAFAGRPNTWGQRSANILLAQADLVVALGTRLGIQQTGFNWDEWGPVANGGRVVQIDVDADELAKGHPKVDVPLHADANRVLELIAAGTVDVDPAWMAFCSEVRALVPLLDPENSDAVGYLTPYALVDQLSDVLGPDDLMIPASSGSGNFVPMEVFRMKTGQRVLTNKGLASMGYGLAAAMGAALAAPGRRTVLVEGDGSFSQNISELGTVALHNLPLKIFLLDNDGYASIRTTQRNYFGGAYLGCDSATGLGFPHWGKLAEAFDIPWIDVDEQGLDDPSVRAMLDAPGPAVFVVKVDPEQTYFPKVTSRVAEDGSMVSNPIHFMTPPLPAALSARVFRYIEVLS